MTSSTRTDNNNPNYANIKGEQRGLTPVSNSSDNMIKGLEYNFNYWNPAMPPSNTTPITPHTPMGGHPQRQQQQQQQSHTPALSTSSTLYNAPSSPEAQANNRGPAANPSYSTSNISGNMNTNTADNSAYTWHATNPNSSYATNNSSSSNNNNTSYNWHATNPYPPYQTGTDYNPGRLTPLEEEQSRTTSHVGVPSWTSEFESELGFGRNPSTLHRNVSTRRESPTLGTGTAWNSRNRDPVASRNTQETDMMDREQDFEYDMPRTGGKSYFARLQAMSGLSGYTIGNPFTSRI